MQNVEVFDGKNESQGASARNWWRQKPGRRATTVALAVAGVAAGLYLGWGWVVTAGLSSLVLGLLPCVAMCGAGLCMNLLGQKNACKAAAVSKMVDEPGDIEVPAITAAGNVPPLGDESATSNVQLTGR